MSCDKMWFLLCLLSRLQGTKQQLQVCQHRDFPAMPIFKGPPSLPQSVWVSLLSSHLPPRLGSFGVRELGPQHPNQARTETPSSSLFSVPPVPWSPAAHRGCGDQLGCLTLGAETICPSQQACAVDVAALWPGASLVARGAGSRSSLYRTPP